MDTSRTRSQKGEPLFSRPAAERPWRGCVRTLVSMVLLFTFLHSVFLSAAPCRNATPAGTQTVAHDTHNAQPPADHPVDPGAEPLENAPDEEGDSGENAEPDEDFLTDEAAAPRFSRLLLKQLGYGEPAPGRFSSPLPGFSPPPERVS